MVGLEVEIGDPERIFGLSSSPRYDGMNGWIERMGSSSVSAGEMWDERWLLEGPRPLLAVG